MITGGVDQASCGLHPPASASALASLPLLTLPPSHHPG